MDWWLYSMMEANKAEQARELARRMRVARRARARTTKAVDEVKDDLGFLALILLSLLGSLVRKGVVTREEIVEQIDSLDELDGNKDGMLTPEVLWSALGLAVPKPEPEPPSAPKPSPRRRRRR